MIRVVMLDEFDAKQVVDLSKLLYTSFGVGCEVVGVRPVPAGVGDPIVPSRLLEKLDNITAYPDDKVLVLTSRPLADRPVPSGTAPSIGYAQQGLSRALVSTHPATDLESSFKLISRNALHQLGHTWELHHCLDPRCAMYPPWTPSFQTGEAMFCNFCRDKSDHKIRLAKS
ncbi:MAG: hypothetical protein ACKVPX_11860 [Myxococcaceae bacterium]